MTSHFLNITLLCFFFLNLSVSARAQTAIPTVLAPCIKKLNTRSNSIKTVFINATYAEEGKTYYLINLFPFSIELGVYDAVIASDSSSCQILARYRSSDIIPVNDSLTLSVARGLTLALVKSEIQEAGGIQQYQDFLNRSATDTGRLYLEANRVWALQQLGVRLLPSIKILPPSSDRNR
jgi:hypothetical protein